MKENKNFNKIFLYLLLLWEESKKSIKIKN
jgi:hypothetical protein